MNLNVQVSLEIIKSQLLSIELIFGKCIMPFRLLNLVNESAMKSDFPLKMQVSVFKISINKDRKFLVQVGNG